MLIQIKIDKVIFILMNVAGVIICQTICKSDPADSIPFYTMKVHIYHKGESKLIFFNIEGSIFIKSIFFHYVHLVDEKDRHGNAV